MRYRTFGLTGTATSAVSVTLTEMKGWRAADWTALIYAALEQGVNTFEIAGHSPAILDGVAEGLGSIERHLVFVALRLGSTATGGRDFSAESLTRTTEAVIARTGIEYLDVVLLDDPAEDALSPEALAALKALRAAGQTRMIGVAGENPALDYYISTGAFQVLSMPYSMTTGWMDRHRLKAAIDHEMAVIGYGFVPEDLNVTVAEAQPVKQGLWGRKPSNPLAGAGTYAFLQTTPGWTMEELCLAFALTEPSLATVQITPDQARRMEAFASVAERDLPSGLSSRIEMARFSDSGEKSQARGQG